METKKLCERNFVNPSRISPHLYCSICVEIFHKPTRTNCGHTFCSRCIMKWVCQRGTCPECREIIKLRKLQPDLIVSKIIDDLQVFCTSKDSCAWRGKLEDLGLHIKSCKYQTPREIPGWVHNCKNAIEIIDSEENNLQKGIPEPKQVFFLKRSVRVLHASPLIMPRLLCANPAVSMCPTTSVPLVYPHPIYLQAPNPITHPHSLSSSPNTIQAFDNSFRPFCHGLNQPTPLVSDNRHPPLERSSNAALKDKRERPYTDENRKIEHFLNRKKRRVSLNE